METYEPAPGRKTLVARLPGSDPTAPSLTLLGHTDVVPANAVGLVPRPLRRRAHRRRGVGPWRHRHAQPHHHHGHRLPPPGPRRLPSEGRPHLHRRGRRGGAVDLRRPVAVRQPPRRRPQRLRHHRVGRLPHERCRRPAPAARHRGREGRLLVRPDRDGHPGPRQPAPAHRQRAGQGGRGGATHRRVPPPGRAPRGLGALHRRPRVPPGAERAAPRPRPHRRLLRRAAPARPGPPGPRLHPHHHGPDHPPRRHQAQRDPRPGGAVGRHPVAARVGDRRGAGHARRRARRPGRLRRGRLPRRGARLHLPHRHPAVGRPAAGQPPLLPRARRTCRS